MVSLPKISWAQLMIGRKNNRQMLHLVYVSWSQGFHSIVPIMSWTERHGLLLVLKMLLYPASGRIYALGLVGFVYSVNNFKGDSVRTGSVFIIKFVNFSSTSVHLKRCLICCHCSPCF
jgi:hypothetical protein